MHVNPFRRMQTGLFALVLSLLFVVGLKAQTATLTPGQKAAIRSSRPQVVIESATVLAVRPAPSTMFGRQSPPGSLLVTQREADRNTRFNTTASAEFTYLLTPTPDGGWKALNTGQTVSLDQRAIEQDRKLQVPRSMYSGFDLFMMAFAVVAFIGLAVLGWLMSVANRQGTVAKKISCPGCKVVNYPAPSLCGNCGGGKTRLRKAEDRKGYRTIVTYCESCFARTTFDPYCIKCETDLTLPLARKFALPTLRGAIHALLFDAPAPRPDKAALLIFATLVFAASSLAQTATLTPGQAAAIKAEETRWNSKLGPNGQFGYASLAFQLDHTEAVPKDYSSYTKTSPPAGSVIAVGIEQRAGGHGPQPGFQVVRYWLYSLGGDSWKAGSPAPVFRFGTIYPARDGAYAELHSEEIAAQQTREHSKRLLSDAPVIIKGLIVVLLFFAVFIVGPIYGVIWSRRRNVVPSQVTCPKCRTVNIPQPGLCANCSSMNTFLAKRKVRKYRRITTVCRDCDSYTQFDPYCVNCETNLTNVLLRGAGSVVGPQ